MSGWRALKDWLSGLGDALMTTAEQAGHFYYPAIPEGIDPTAFDVESRMLPLGQESPWPTSLSESYAMSRQTPSCDGKVCHCPKGPWPMSVPGPWEDTYGY